ncbi:MAG: hypothetical protein J3K34DRAFT_456094 [Monoraphidium minutum]|nr:MAG: hypothetical protein J3K34DRAFT_456094 [Monoraphidium minutum]
MDWPPSCGLICASALRPLRGSAASLCCNTRPTFDSSGGVFCTNKRIGTGRSTRQWLDQVPLVLGRTPKGTTTLHARVCCMFNTSTRPFDGQGLGTRDAAPGSEISGLLMDGFLDQRVHSHPQTQQLWAVVSGQARMEPSFSRRELRPPRQRDIRLDEFSAWGPDCGDMFFFPEGALNILFSPADRNFSVKLKYMGFAPDGYCKRINACSHGEFYCAIRLLHLVREKWPRQFKAWINRVCANVGSGGKLGVPPPAADEPAGAGGDAPAFIHLLTRAEEAQVLDWPQWPQVPVGKAAGYLKALHTQVESSARGRYALTWEGVWSAIKREVDWAPKDAELVDLPEPVHLVRPAKAALAGALAVTEAAVAIMSGAAPAGGPAAGGGRPAAAGDDRRRWGDGEGGRREASPPRGGVARPAAGAAPQQRREPELRAERRAAGGPGAAAGAAAPAGGADAKARPARSRSRSGGASSGGRSRSRSSGGRASSRSRSGTRGAASASASGDGLSGLLEESEGGTAKAGGAAPRQGRGAAKRAAGSKGAGASKGAGGGPAAMEVEGGEAPAAAAAAAEEEPRPQQKQPRKRAPAGAPDGGRGRKRPEHGAEQRRGAAGEGGGAAAEGGGGGGDDEFDPEELPSAGGRAAATPIAGAGAAGARDARGAGSPDQRRGGGGGEAGADKLVQTLVKAVRQQGAPKSQLAAIASALQPRAAPPAAAPPTAAAALLGLPAAAAAAAAAAPVEDALAARLRRAVERRLEDLVASREIESVIDAAVMARIDRYVETALSGPAGDALLAGALGGLGGGDEAPGGGGGGDGMLGGLLGRLGGGGGLEAAG